MKLLNKINFLITPKQRKKLIILSLFIFIGMILEIVGLSILIPILSILLEPETYQNNFLILNIYSFLPDLSQQNLIFLFLSFIVFVYILKSAFMVFLTYRQNKFLSNISADLSNTLYYNYLNQSYSFHLEKNASELIKNLQLEVSYFYQYLIALISFLTELCFASSLLLTLIYIEPVGALAVFIFLSLLSIIFLIFSKRKLKEWGELRQALDTQISKITLEGLGSIKEILIAGTSNFFIEQYQTKNKLKAKLVANNATISQVPRFYLELISILGLVLFIIFMIYQGKSLSVLITVLGVFVAATFRIIPSINKIIAALQNMKFYGPSVNMIFQEIKNTYHLKSKFIYQKPYAFKANIEFNNVSFSFKDNKYVLEEVNLEIKSGQIIGLIGESGSGKSTLVDLLIGLHHPSKGNIFIDGVRNFQLEQSWKNSIGYVPQTIYLTDDSIINNIGFGIQEDKINLKRVDEIIDQVQLKDFIRNLKLGLNTRVGERGVQLSGGQRQRIGLARALYNNPSILVLDEATSALDSYTEIKIMESIMNFKKDKTVIIIAHRLQTLVNADVIYSIKNKKIIQVEIESDLI